MFTKSTSWHSYPSIFNLGHRAVADLFTEDVIVQEKIDGSQFSFGVFDGELKCRSKGAEIQVDQPEKMFTLAVETAKRLASDGLLTDGWTYRGEYLSKPKHNALKYDRVPKGNIILFDINIGEEEYLDYAVLTEVAELLGLEVVPQFAVLAEQWDEPTLRNCLEFRSILGDVKIEGLVIKSLSLYGQDKKRLMGKYVSEAFKEIHKKEWGESNPTGKDIIQRLVERYKTEARWHKVVQHLRDDGRLTDSPKDIGPLIGELQADLLKECEDDAKQQLFKWAWQSIERGAAAGFAEWYKGQLLSKQFEGDTSVT